MHYVENKSKKTTLSLCMVFTLSLSSCCSDAQNPIDLTSASNDNIDDIVSFNDMEKSQKLYKKAIGYIYEEDYPQAMGIFMELGDYKDSKS